MKKFLGAAAVCVAALVAGAAASSADTVTPSYNSGFWGEVGGSNGDWGGTHSGSWSASDATGRFSATASASEPSGAVLANGIPAYAAVRVRTGHHFTATAGAYRLTVVLSDIDATLSGGDWADASFEAAIDPSCDCPDWSYDTETIATTDVVHRSVSLVDGTYTLTKDITLASDGDMWVDVETWTSAVASSSFALMHGGPATASVSALVESISIDAL